MVTCLFARLSAVFTSAAFAVSFLADAAVAASPAQDPANWRKVDPENLLLLTVNKFPIYVELRPDFAPKHVAQIKKIVRAGHYNGTAFHRVIDDFMAQGGEVSAIYMLATPYPQIKAEFTFRRKPAQQPVQWLKGGHEGYLDGFAVGGQPDALAGMTADQSVQSWARHCSGIASMARADDPDSADTQFFLMRQTAQGLDKKYTIWGRAVIGVEAIRGIKAAAAEEASGKVESPDKLTKAQIVADMPAAARPVVYVQRTDGPEFAAKLASTTDDICSLPPVQAVVETPAQ